MYITKHGVPLTFEPPAARTNGHEEESRSERRWPAPLSDTAFHGLAGEYVRLIEPASEADPAALLLQFLTAAGNVIGPRPHYMVEDTAHHMNMYLVLIGLTGKSRKGTSWNRVKRPFLEADPAWSIGSGLSSGEGLIEQVRDADGEHEGVADKRLLVMQGEFSSVLRVMDRDGNTLAAVLREAWDGDQLRTMTRKSNALRSNGSHISLIGHITRDELRQHLTETDKANGFANRILWACVKRSKELPEELEIDGKAWREISARTKQAIAWAQKAERMERNADAQIIWRRVYHDLSEGEPGMFGAMTARGDAYVLRLSCLYALLDQCRSVGPEHMEAALEVWRYCEDSARYIFGDQLRFPVGGQHSQFAARREHGPFAHRDKQSAGQAQNIGADGYRPRPTGRAQPGGQPRGNLGRAAAGSLVCGARRTMSRYQALVEEAKREIAERRARASGKFLLWALRGAL